MAVERRIYVVLPRTIDIPWEDKFGFPMSCGRLVAQACHAVSKLKIQEGVDPEERITTIVLQTPNSCALEAIRAKISKANVPWVTWEDDNEEVYGTKLRVLTAVAAYCSRKKGKSLFFGIDSWKCE